jgi:hypothetical protein
MKVSYSNSNGSMPNAYMTSQAELLWNHAIETENYDDAAAAQRVRRYATLPSPEMLRAELHSQPPPPGIEEPYALQIGCEGCPNAACLIAAWLSKVALIDIMDQAPGIPRGFVAGNLSAIGQARACPISEQTNQPDCQYEPSVLQSVIAKAVNGSDTSPAL